MRRTTPEWFLAEVLGCAAVCRLLHPEVDSAAEGCEQSSCVTFKHKTLTTEGEWLQAHPSPVHLDTQPAKAVPVLQALELSPGPSVHPMLELVIPLHSSSKQRHKSEGWLVCNKTLQC